uniref:Cytochrome P450 n=1 Tax=Leersia perrieri TaxID=77586 RepID=A0A0D9V6V5_9ORYZ
MGIELSLTSSVPLFLLLLIPVLCFLCLRHGATKQPGADGLKAYPIVGTLPHFVKNQHRLIEWSAGVVARCPTHTMSFNFKSFGLMAGAITANPANVEYIVKTNFQNYPKGEYVVSVIEDFLGHGIFNSDGDQWLWQRKAASYEFSKRSLRNFVVSAVRFEVVERLLPLLQRAERDGRTLDVQDVLERFAFDNVCCVAFDEDPACLTEEGMGTTNARSDFLRDFNDAQNIVMARFMSPVKWAWRAKRMLGLEPERRMREALATIHGYAERIVRERRERGAAGLARSDDFLSRFAAGGEHSDESLRDVVTNFVLAGRDTTSSALTWFFWLVSGRPDVESKIVREIRAVRAANGSTDTVAFSFDELRKMHYLHATITESMRLYPPVAMDSHCCQEDDVLPDGTFVGKGWQVTYSAYAMARLEDIWGKDCEEYRPERWLDEDGVFRPESPFKYPIFHAGPRMCLGKEMAYIQMKSIVACVFERFSFRFVGDEGRRPGLVFSVTLRMEGGLPMQVKKRMNSSS